MSKKFLLLFLVSLISISAAQSFEIKFDIQNASGWFGGDDRPNQTRNVAVAQSVNLELPITLQSFSFYFSSPFDFALNATGTGHNVSLRLHIRDSVGTVLDTVDVAVLDTFTHGWITWSDIGLELNAPAKFIFSTYLVGGYDSNQVFTGQGCDLNAGYSGGERYSKYVVNDSDAVIWGDWSEHSWDANFWLVGFVNPTEVNYNISAPIQFKLSQNYPNPFNPSTKISWQSPVSSWQTLKIYDLLGNEVATLVNEFKPAGIYEVEFNAENLASGMYLYKIQAGSFVETKKMILLR